MFLEKTGHVLKISKSLQHLCLFLCPTLVALHQALYWVCPDSQPSVHAQNNDPRENVATEASSSLRIFSLSVSLVLVLSTTLFCLQIFGFLFVWLVLLVVLHRDADRPPAPTYNLET